VLLNLNMESSHFKDATTSRGLIYHYYFSPAQASKPTLLFCHGFPSTARDWRYIVPHFENQGYGVVVPDMLGYGGTDKPTDPAAYVGSAIVKDLVDILDSEGIQKVVAIGHDW
jgi:soluble epoxide hydrolase / lipid-phosphate phosphatase